MSSLERKIARNILKRQQGNNKIREEWNKFQIFKFGLGQYELLQKQNKKRR